MSVFTIDYSVTKFTFEYDEQPAVTVTVDATVNPPVTAQEIADAVEDYLTENQPGIPDHNDTTLRDAADAHPISSITGLEDALDNAGGGTSLDVFWGAQTWEELYDQLVTLEGPIKVWVDENKTIPSGTWSGLSSLQFGHMHSADWFLPGGARVLLEDGCTFPDMIWFTAAYGLLIQSESTAPIIESDAPLLLLYAELGGAFASATAPILSGVGGPGQVVVITLNAAGRALNGAHTQATGYTGGSELVQTTAGNYAVLALMSGKMLVTDDLFIGDGMLLTYIEGGVSVMPAGAGVPVHSNFVGTVVPAELTVSADLISYGGTTIGDFLDSLGGDAVTSVNGYTGDITLGASDVGADPAGTAAALVDDLSGVSNQSTARTNLGLGSAATSSTGDFAAASHNHAASAITSGTIDTARLGSGSASSSTYLRGDQTWQTITSGSGDVVGPASSTDGRAALFDGTTGKLLKVASAAPVLEGDSRLTDARAPLWRRLTFSNADYNLGSAPNPAVAGSVALMQTGTLNAARTVTLPAASAVPAGGEVIVNAGAGASATNTVSIARAGSDTINGASTSLTIGTPWGQRRLVSDGVSAWTHDDGLMRRSQNLADLESAATARTNLGIARLEALSQLGAQTQINDATSGFASGVGAVLLDSAPTIASLTTGEFIEFEALTTVTNNSGGNRTYNFGVTLGSTTVQTGTVTLTNTNVRTFYVRGFIIGTGSSAQSIGLHTHTTNVNTGAAGTATETVSSSTLQLRILSNASTATQTAQLLAFNMRKVSP